MKGLKVGELARRTGITVRTLHHYDALGLLSPAARTASGYRLYGAKDVVRLQQILSMRQLGFSLEEIEACLGEASFTPLRVIELHLERLQERIAAQERLRDRLAGLAEQLRMAHPVSPDEFIQTMEMMTMFDKYYTPEQLKQLEERRTAVGEERIREVEAEWPRLMAEVQAQMDKGTDPTDPRVQQLAERWMGLVREFTGGDPGIQKSLENLYEGESSVRGMDTGPMREMGAYIGRAMEERWKK